MQKLKTIITSLKGLNEWVKMLAVYLAAIVFAMVASFMGYIAGVLW